MLISRGIEGRKRKKSRSREGGELGGVRIGTTGNKG